MTRKLTRTPDQVLSWRNCLVLGVFGAAAALAGCSTATEAPLQSYDASQRPTVCVADGTAADSPGLGAAADVNDLYVEESEVETAEINDPLEDVNRATFAVNDAADRYLLGPVARGYGYITPQPAKAALRRAISNLGAPSRLVNDLLQGEFTNAGTTGGRFLVNSTAGVAGLFDVADDFCLEHHDSDFDQTLQVYGAGTGPYVVLPLIGPNSVRGTVGFVGDIFLDPLGQLLPTSANLAIGGSEAITTREAYDEQIETLRETSLDHYAAVRSIYTQHRDNQVDEQSSKIPELK